MLLLLLTGMLFRFNLSKVLFIFFLLAQPLFLHQESHCRGMWVTQTNQAHTLMHTQRFNVKTQFLKFSKRPKCT